jgi:hypothetical protein
MNSLLLNATRKKQKFKERLAKVVGDTSNLPDGVDNNNLAQPILSEFMDIKREAGSSKQTIKQKNKK